MDINDKDLMNHEHRCKLRDFIDINKLNWRLLSKNASAIYLLEKNLDKIHWHYLSLNSSIFELDYDFLHRRMNIIRQELISKTWHPQRFMKWCLSIDELVEF